MQPPRSIFIDALNLSFWCGNPPSLRLPLTALIHLQLRGYEVRLFFDASTVHRLADEADLYRRLLPYSDVFIEAPSGTTADRLLLRQARAREACILSRDHFRDHRKRYRKLIDEPGRLISGSIERDRLRLPLLSLDVPLAGSAEAAWAALEPILAA